jgi:hypothetical protein
MIMVSWGRRKHHRERIIMLFIQDLKAGWMYLVQNFGQENALFTEPGQVQKASFNYFPIPIPSL